MNNRTLHDGLVALKRRVIGVGVVGGIGRGLVCALCLILLAAWADLVVDLPSRLRLSADLLALIGLTAVCLAAAIAAIRSAPPASVARRVDEVARGEGQVLSGVDLSMASSAGAAALPVTAGLARIAVDRAA